MDLAKATRETAGREPAGGSQAFAATRGRGRALAVVTGALVIGFAQPLYDLVRFAAREELYSHILLIPFVSLYLVWSRRTSQATEHGPIHCQPPGSIGHILRAVLPLFAGLALLAGYWIAIGSGWHGSRNDSLAVTTLAFLLLFIAACCFLLNQAALRGMAFPLAFLLFMVPFPSVLEHGLEVFFQHCSAVAAGVMLKVSGTTFLRDGVAFQVPGIKLTVGEECSGIHSSLVLFMTGLLAGHCFLQTPWKKAVLAFAVIPLAILRNGFRIFTIAQLCIHISPDMIESWVHRRGGPLFFVLSLVPFFWLLLWLRKTEGISTVKERDFTPVREWS